VKEFAILISDKNRNVRSFLRREMEAQGYKVLTANTARDTMELIYQPILIDLVILDPELPDAEEMSIIKSLNNRIPSLPVVVHSFSQDCVKHISDLSTVHFVEKKGSSIEHLIKVVSALLDKSVSE